MALPMGYKGRTLIDMIELEKEKLENYEDVMYADKIEGIELALDILRNPFKYLKDTEVDAWKRAEAMSKTVSRPLGTTTQHQDVAARKAVREPTIGEARAKSVKVVRRRSGE